MSRKKLLILNYEFPPFGGGGGVVTYDLSKELVRAYDIDVLTGGNSDSLKEEIIDGMNVYRVNVFRNKKYKGSLTGSFIYLVRGYILGSRLIKENNYDLCHVHFVLPTGVLSYVFKKQFNLDYVITLHGSDVPGFNTSLLNRYYHFVFEPFLKVILKHAKAVVSGSNYLANLLKKVSKVDVEIIKHGFDLTKIVPLKKEKIILASGRFTKHKNFKGLIEEFEKIDSNYKLHLIGDGPERENLDKFKNNNIIFHGWLDNNSDEYKNLFGKADIFVHLSKNENFSVVLQEAMSAGCAIIANDVGGNKEVLLGSAILIRDDGELKEKVEELIQYDDLRKGLQKKSREVSEITTWNKCTDEYIEVFNS